MGFNLAFKGLNTRSERDVWLLLY